MGEKTSLFPQKGKFKHGWRWFIYDGKISHNNSESNNFNKNKMYIMGKIIDEIMNIILIKNG